MEKLSIEIPVKLETINEKTNSDSSLSGVYSAEPFEPGYGHTIGNSIRRILLSSLEGSSIIAVRFKGLVHEYQSIKGVKEDVLVILANIKRVRFKVYTQNVERIGISVKGKAGEPVAVKASDIKTTQNVEVVNENQEICTVNASGNFDCELYIGKGRGYVPFDQHDRSLYNFPVDVIYTDSLFSPVLKANYWVEPARKGQKVDFDKLMFEVVTDGSLNPREALTFSAKVLRDALKPYYGEDTRSVIEEKEEEIEAVEDMDIDAALKEKMDMSVTSIELSVRSQNCLKAAKIRTVGELIRKSEPDLLNYKNFGKKSFNEIIAKLKDMGLSLGMDLKKKTG